jgi:cytosine/adenosine deaminase-related metal-dependent hydrolase
LTALKSAARRRRQPFTIHLAESAEETAFLTSGRGAWADFMRQRGITFDSWPLNGRGPVAYCRDLGLLDGDTLAVHLLQAQKDDWRLLAECGVKVCVCPRSNRLLHGRLPDVSAMLAAGLRPALGTDSLASTPSLSLFDEMRHVADSYPEIAPRQILAMGTVNGAEALGCGARYGRLLPGASAALIYVDIQAAAEEPLLEAIVVAGEPLAAAAAEEAS